MGAGEVGLEGVELIGPEAAVAVDPAIELGEALPPQGVDAPLAVGGDLDEPRLLQHLEVPGDRRLGETRQGGGELQRGLGAPEQGIEQRAATGVGDGGEDVHAPTYES